MRDEGPTPLPWPIPEYDNHGNGSFHEWWDLASGRFTCEADAILAWQAVNSYRALLGACEQVMEEFNDRYDGAPDAGYQWMGELMRTLESAIAKAHNKAA